MKPPNNAINPPHSVVTALAQGGKRRAAGRAGYRARSTDNEYVKNCCVAGMQAADSDNAAAPGK